MITLRSVKMTMLIMSLFILFATVQRASADTWVTVVYGTPKPGFDTITITGPAAPTGYHASTSVYFVLDTVKWDNGTVQNYSGPYNQDDGGYSNETVR